jgi:hypothetical protein
VLEKALREQARERFAERLAHYAPLLGVTCRGCRCRRRDALGKLQPTDRHSPELAADPFPAAGGRLRGGCTKLAHLREMNHSRLPGLLVHRCAGCTPIIELHGWN